MAMAAAAASYSGSDGEGDSCSGDSDRELQESFAQGKLKPGLNLQLKARRPPINNVNQMKSCLSEFRRLLPWVERLDVTVGPLPDVEAQASGSDGVDVENDFRREMFFYRQAQAAVLLAVPKLQELNILTKRPEDYFAEMAKTDQHMQKVREKLLSKQMAMERSEKAKQLRQLRKYGKKVQVEVLQQRQKEKKSMMESLKKYKKGVTDKLDFLEADKEGARTQNKPSAAGKDKKRNPNSKRRYKNEKFGFGGKKRGNKRNTRDSVDDVSGFRSRTAHGREGGPRGRTGKAAGNMGKNKRPGKTVRQKMKSKRR
ncbi:putative rRNA-processing protein EBP2 [Lampetra fluviatilis]